MISYHDIPFTSRTVDRSVALAAELIEERLADEHPPIPAAHVHAGAPEDVLDGDQQRHRLADLLRARVAVTDLAVERLNEVAIVGDPHADRRPAVVGHGESWILQGLSDTGGETA